MGRVILENEYENRFNRFGFGRLSKFPTIGTTGDFSNFRIVLDFHVVAYSYARTWYLVIFVTLFAQLSFLCSRCSLLQSRYKVDAGALNKQE